MLPKFGQMLMTCALTLIQAMEWQLREIYQSGKCALKMALIVRQDILRFCAFFTSQTPKQTATDAGTENMGIPGMESFFLKV